MVGDKKMTIEQRAEQYNMPKGSTKKPKYRFTANGWASILTYINWDIEKARKEAAITPKIELLNSIRFKELVCNDHYLLHGMAGQAFSDYTCLECKRTEMYHNTNTPVYCRYCAFTKNHCQRCEEPIGELCLG